MMSLKTGRAMRATTFVTATSLAEIYIGSREDDLGHFVIVFTNIAGQMRFGGKSGDRSQTRFRLPIDNSRRDRS